MFDVFVRDVNAAFSLQRQKPEGPEGDAGPHRSMKMTGLPPILEVPTLRSRGAVIPDRSENQTEADRIWRFGCWGTRGRTTGVSCPRVSDQNVV